jgi:lipooligosaccharide transport system ATP-binding protein
MEGKPLELLRDNIEKYVLELLGEDTIEEIQSREISISVRIDKGLDIVRLYSDSITDLRQVADMLETDHYHLRQSNLEDVFLKATGRTLNAQQ